MNKNIIKKILVESSDDIIVNRILKNKAIKSNIEKLDKKYKGEYRKGDRFLIDDIGIMVEGVLGIYPDDKIWRKLIDTIFYKITGLPKRGGRIRLIYMDDPSTTLKKGDEGTVLGYQMTPWGTQIRVEWDNGSRLDIIPEADEFIVLS